MKHLTYQDLKKWQAEGRSFQLIDVREPEEHEAFNIGGQLIPLSEISKSKNLLQSDQPIVVYCKRGIRSQIAIQRWSAQLPKYDFYNLDAGVEALKRP